MKFQELKEVLKNSHEGEELVFNFPDECIHSVWLHFKDGKPLPVGGVAYNQVEVTTGEGKKFFGLDPLHKVSKSYSELNWLFGRTPTIHENDLKSLYEYDAKIERLKKLIGEEEDEEHRKTLNSLQEEKGNLLNKLADYMRMPRFDVENKYAIYKRKQEVENANESEESD